MGENTQDNKQSNHHLCYKKSTVSSRIENGARDLLEVMLPSTIIIIKPSQKVHVTSKTNTRGWDSVQAGDRKEDPFYLLLLSGGYWVEKIGWVGRSHEGLRERGLDAGQSRHVKECTSLLHSSRGIDVSPENRLWGCCGNEGDKCFFPFVPLQIPLKNLVH